MNHESNNNDDHFVGYFDASGFGKNNIINDFYLAKHHHNLHQHQQQQQQQHHHSVVVGFIPNEDIRNRAVHNILFSQQLTQQPAKQSETKNGLQFMNESWDVVLRSNENDIFINNPEEIIKELNKFATSNLSDSQSNHGYAPLDAPLTRGHHGITSVPLSNAFPSKTNLSDDVLASSIRQSKRMRDESSNDYNCNEKHQKQQHHHHQKQQQLLRQALIKRREQGLKRYREKRSRRVYNRIRYSHRKVVSQTRPRVKGRFVKIDPFNSIAPITLDFNESNDSFSSKAADTNTSNMNVDINASCEATVKTFNTMNATTPVKPSLISNSPNSLASTEPPATSYADVDVDDILDFVSSTPSLEKQTLNQRVLPLHLETKFAPQKGLTEEKFLDFPMAPSSGLPRNSIIGLLRRYSSNQENQPDLGALNIPFNL